MGGGGDAGAGEGGSDTADNAHRMLLARVAQHASQTFMLSARLQKLKQAVDELHAAGVKVLLA